MADIDDDIFGDDPEDEEQEAAPAATGSTPAEPEPLQAAPAPAAAPDPNAELLQAALGTLKSAWAKDAKEAGYGAADFSQVGMKGFDEDAKAAFMAEAKASHEAQVKELEAKGFHYDPQRNAEAERKAAEAAADAAQKDQWGPMDTPSSATEGEVADQATRAAVEKGDTVSAIKSLAGLGDFMLGRKR
jgi:regulator of protease activity HflC (stomatin/prohibitin superfamily)